MKIFILKDGTILNLDHINSITPVTRNEVLTSWVTSNYTADEWEKVKEEAPYGSVTRQVEMKPLFTTVQVPIVGYQVMYGDCGSTTIHPDDYGKIISVLEGESGEQGRDDPEIYRVYPQRPAKCSGKLPRLTRIIFRRPDCPYWAKWAAVSKDGTAQWFSGEPEIDGDKWVAPGNQKSQRIYKFYSVSWENTKIQRKDGYVD